MMMRHELFFHSYAFMPRVALPWRHAATTMPLIRRRHTLRRLFDFFAATPLRFAAAIYALFFAADVFQKAAVAGLRQLRCFADALSSIGNTRRSMPLRHATPLIYARTRRVRCRHFSIFHA